MSHFKVSRRRALASLSGAGLYTASCQDGGETDVETKITQEMLHYAHRMIGLEFTREERELMRKRVHDDLGFYQKLREVSLANSVAPAHRFDPIPPGDTISSALPQADVAGETDPSQAVAKQLPPSDSPLRSEELAYWPVTRLAGAIRNRRVSSLDLTRMYLKRLEKHHSQLECVISFTREMALEQAERADDEIRQGRYRGPLHGIPWGAKDLLAVQGYRTTWGAASHRDQVLEMDATVVQRLEESGAVLLAKLSLGALAGEDVWFGGKTRNPWKLDEGSLGSSAGSAATTATGLVGFSIGSETLGSIVFPSTTCGVTGLRPTFGRVSRHGAMVLSWSMDKIGPICRSAEDCALVFQTIQGLDPQDRSTVDVPFHWDFNPNLDRLRVGYAKRLFEDQEDGAIKSNGERTLETLSKMGVDLIPIELPKRHVAPEIVLYTEAAAAFDEFTRSNQDDLLVEQMENNWPNMLRQARTIPAVEYIQNDRLRALLMQDMAELMSGFDLYLAPSFGENLNLTNLTGHPCVSLPNGFDPEGRPTSISFTGRLYGENEILTLAKAYQDTTDFHLKQPPLFQIEA